MKFWCLQITQKANKILDRYVPYEGRAEICQNIGWHFWEILRHQNSILRLTDLQQLWSGFIQESLSQASHNGHHFNEFIATQIDVNISISGFFVNQTTTDKHLTKEKLSHTSKKKDLLCACLECPFKHQTGYYACISGQKLCSLKQLHFLWWLIKVR